MIAANAIQFGSARGGNERARRLATKVRSGSDSDLGERWAGVRFHLESGPDLGQPVRLLSAISRHTPARRITHPHEGYLYQGSYYRLS
jgi:hypothetical protein